MATMNRMVLTWEGQQIQGDGKTVLCFDGSDSEPDVAAVLGAWEMLEPILPSGVTITVPGTGDKFNDTNGTLTGVWAQPGGGTVVGAGGPNCAAGVGACIGWQTGGIVNGRRLRGRTFIVPLINIIYDVDGTIIPTTMTLLQSFANALQVASPLGIWHRPTTPGGVDGTSYGVVSNRVRDKVAFLTSRRD